MFLPCDADGVAQRAGHLSPSAVCSKQNAWRTSGRRVGAVLGRDMMFSYLLASILGPFG